MTNEAVNQQKGAWMFLADKALVIISGIVIATPMAIPKIPRTSKISFIIH